EAHGKNRSEKFRANHPDEYVYARTHWKSYVQEARERYVRKLTDPTVSDAEKHRIHTALVLEHELGLGRERDNRLQLRRDSQQFEGDPFENRKIADKFGKSPNSLKDLLLNSTTPM